MSTEIYLSTVTRYSPCPLSPISLPHNFFFYSTVGFNTENNGIEKAYLCGNFIGFSCRDCWIYNKGRKANCYLPWDRNLSQVLIRDDWCPSMTLVTRYPSNTFPRIKSNFWWLQPNWVSQTLRDYPLKTLVTKFRLGFKNVYPHKSRNELVPTSTFLDSWCSIFFITSNL